jgi:Ca2+-binding EF-hand superfamily protein
MNSEVVNQSSSANKRSFEDHTRDAEAPSLSKVVADHEKDINDELTVENMFRVFDKEAGAMVDIREIMDINEEDFKENPELLNIIRQMNQSNPIEDAKQP